MLPASTTGSRVENGREGAGDRGNHGARASLVRTDALLLERAGVGVCGRKVHPVQRHLRPLLPPQPLPPKRKREGKNQHIPDGSLTGVATGSLPHGALGDRVQAASERGGGAEDTGHSSW